MVQILYVTLQVSSLKLHPRQSPTPAASQLLVIGVGDQVKVHVPGNDPGSMATIHHVVGQRVGCTDCREGQVVMSITETDYNVGVTMGGNHKVKQLCFFG